MSFFFEETVFDIFTLEHFYPILLFAVVAVSSIYTANSRFTEKQKTQLGVLLAAITLAAVIIRMFIIGSLGDFSAKEELPLHLCRIIPFIAVWAMWKRNRFWLGILYFWIIVGTLNANITPDLQRGFPHFEYLIYFTIHSGLLVLPFYSIFVYKMDIRFRDFINAYLMINAFLLFTYFVNFVLGSNYMFTMHKPPVASLFDLLGPWPWYLFFGQFLVLALMLVAYLPFWIKRTFLTSS